MIDQSAKLGRTVLLILFLLNGGISVVIASFSPTFSVIVPQQLQQDYGYKFAFRELKQALQKVYGLSAQINPDIVTLQELRPNTILVGRANKLNHKLIEKGYLDISGNLGAEGYLLKSVDYQAKPLICILGGDVRGDLYGIFYFIERIKLTKDLPLEMDIQRRPAFSIRIAGGDSFENALRMGYNTVGAGGITPPVGGITPIGGITPFVLLNKFDPELFPEGSERYQEIKYCQVKLKEKLEKKSEFHLDTICGTDEFEFPAEVLDSKYAPEITEDNFSLQEGQKKWGRGHIFCVGKPKLWELYKTKYREFLQTFPLLDFVQLRLGESYSFLSGGKYVGCGVYDFNGQSYNCSCCWDIGYEERIALTINNTWKVVCQEMQRRYIQRTWDCFNDRFHSNPEVYKSITKRLSGEKNLIFSIKFTKTDFWRYNFPNPTIGIGDIPQVVEFQCQREYEGKGAFPNYPGELHSKAYKYIKEKGAIGISNWHHGGGWGGPELVTDIWNQANIYLVSHLAWDVNADPDELAKEWASLTFGKKSAEKVARILSLSAEAVLKFRYFEEYGKNHFGWTPSQNWIRDDKIRGAERLLPIYEECKNRIALMKREKEEAVEIVQRMIEIFESTEQEIEDKKLYTYALNSLKYELSLVKVVKYFTTAYFYWLHWKESGEEEEEDIARDNIKKWAEEWKYYQEEISKLEGVASLFHDDGMVRTAKKIQSSLGL